MIVSFFHGTHHYKGCDGTFYSSGGFHYGLWSRYLKVFDRIAVSTRFGGHVNSLEWREQTGLRKSSGQNAEIRPIYCYSSEYDLLKHYGEISRAVRQSVLSSDCAIIRLPSVIGLIASREAMRNNTPWMVEVVGCAWDSLWNHGSLKGKVSAPIMFQINRRRIKQAPFAMYVSEHFLQERYPCYGVTEGCSDVEIPHVDHEVLEQRLRRIRSGFNKPVRLGIIGSLNVDYKGHSDAFRALKLLPSGFAELHCLGPGEKERWEELASNLGIKDQVVFCGSLPAGEPIFEWLDDIDVFLIPSLSEGLPRALVEAMSRGCPVIGARTGGIVELIESQYIHERKDYRSLAYMIEALVSNEDEMVVCASRNFNKAKEYYREVLDKKRERFLTEFRSYVEASKR